VLRLHFSLLNNGILAVGRDVNTASRTESGII